MKSTKLGEILMSSGHLTQDQLNFCLEIKKRVNGHKLGYFLKFYNFVDDITIARAISRQVGWGYFEGDYLPNLEMVKSLGLPFFRKRAVYPLRIGDVPAFVFSQTDDTDTTDLLLKQFGQKIQFLIGTESMVNLALEYLDRDAKRKESKSSVSIEREEDCLKWVDELINKAISQGASDIHIESAEKIVEIRFRIDGVLHFVDCIDLKERNKITNIIFNKANINISEFDTFHDARFGQPYQDRTVDIRVSHIPAIAGSTLVLRLLDVGKSTLSLKSLGYCKENWDLIQKLFKKPHGIVLVTGPTGCGKTTTLYSMLNDLKSINTKIITIEDPVEIKVPLLTQVQINEKRGIDFHQAARAFLRHDPDIILIGEIRDENTAKEAIRASITGHKVFSTLHTNTPIDSLLRLKDLGVDLSYIANSLIGVIAQRLLRKLCPACKQEEVVEKKSLDEFEQKYLVQERQKVFRPKESGCGKCTEGYWGRIVVAEILYIDGNIKRFIYENKIESISQYLGQRRDYVTIHKDAARLVQGGVTSIKEAIRILG